MFSNEMLLANLLAILLIACLCEGHFLPIVKIGNANLNLVGI